MATVSRTAWALVVVTALVVLAWLGLRMLTWRLQYMIPAFGVGLVAGVLLTFWLTGRRE